MPMNQCYFRTVLTKRAVDNAWTSVRGADGPGINKVPGFVIFLTRREVLVRETSRSAAAGNRLGSPKGPL